MERTIFIVSLVLTGALGIGLHAETRAEPPGFAEARGTGADSPFAEVAADAGTTAVHCSPESDGPDGATGGQRPDSGTWGEYLPAFKRRTGSSDVNGGADAAESLHRLGLRNDPSPV
jgi:hypothetical protein